MMACRIPLQTAANALPKTAFRVASSAGASGYSTAAAAASNTSNPQETTLLKRDPHTDPPSKAVVTDNAPYMVATYSRPAPVFVRGQGSFLWDLENRKYLDFTSGIAVNALGHCDPEFAGIIADQAKTLVHASNLYHNAWTPALSKLLVETTLASGAMHKLSSVFICNSGSEANEAALKFARKVGKKTGGHRKYELVSFRGGFHGRTMGSLSATHNPKYQKPFSPMVPGFRVGKYNDVGSIKDLVTDRTCGVIVEPIQGEGGINVATEEFLAILAARCREVGAVLIYDEIQCGMSRTGTFWAHANLPREAHPDILTTAKALGNGFPIGATLVSKDVSDKIKVGDHGTTFGGNPLACRLAHYVVSRLSDPELQKQVLEKEKVFKTGFEALRNRFPHLITETRGRGLILGLQLTRNPSPILAAARERGLLVITAGTNTLRFVPPLTISEREIRDGLRILEEAMET